MYDDIDFFQIQKNFYKINQDSAILKIIKIKNIASVDLRQIAQSSIYVIQFIEK